MSDLSSKTDLPLADCFSETAKEVTTFTHSWTIKNFRFLPKEESTVSPLFSADVNDGVHWTLFLEPDGYREENKGFISVFLRPVSCEASVVRASHVISFLNAYHESKATKASRDSHAFEIKSSQWGIFPAPLARLGGWYRFVERNKVLSDTDFPGDTLIVRTETSYTVEKVPSFDPLFPFKRIGAVAFGTIGALVSATTLNSKRGKSLTLESLKAKSTKTTEILKKPLSENRSLPLSSESKNDVEDDKLQGPNIGAGESVRHLSSTVGAKKFDGDRSTFFEWWTDFEARVHRRSLRETQKLVELLDALEGEAKECINTADSPFVANIYFSTLDSLFIRYGNIEALPPGMFALLILRRQTQMTLPLQIVDNRMLMEQIQRVHHVPDAPKSAEFDELECGGKLNESSCDTTSSQKIGVSDVTGGIGQQLRELESLFAETGSPDSLALESIAKKIGLAEATIQMWLKLRPVEWNKALHPDWQLGEVDALRGCLTQTEGVGYDDSDVETSEDESSVPSESDTDFQLV